MNPNKLRSIFNDSETERETNMERPNATAKDTDKILTGLRNDISKHKKHVSEEDVSVQVKNQSDMEADLDRRENSVESNWHSARRFPHYAVVKRMDANGDWDGIFTIQDRRGKPLPRELDQGFTDQGQAIKAIQNYLKSKKLEKETNTNV
jgi:hypothetical protein